MKILAIDTSTEACSVALLQDESCQELFEIAPRQHTQRVLPMVDELLKAAGLSLRELDALVFDCGPGSFTGVRVATSVVQGLAFSAELAVIPVSSLAALAQAALSENNHEKVLSMIDARMNEVYWACYVAEAGLMKLVGEERVSPVTDIKIAGNWHIRGSGWDRFKAELQQSKKTMISGYSAACFPHARDIAILGADLYKQGKVVSAEEAHPSYIRNEVSWKKIADQ